MSETSFHSGGQLAPPPPVSEEVVNAFNSVLECLRAGAVPEEWSPEAKMAMRQAQLFHQHCLLRGSDFKVELERVHEMGAAGPGRSLRLKATWTQTKTEEHESGPRTTVMYIRYGKFEDAVYFVRNILEHCYLV